MTLRKRILKSHPAALLLFSFLLPSLTFSYMIVDAAATNGIEYSEESLMVG